MHCCLHFFLSYLLHFHLSPNRARELEATCWAISVQQLLEVCRQYPQHVLTLCDEPPVDIFDHRTSLHVLSILSSIPCHLEYHLFATIFVKLSVQLFLHAPPCSVTALLAAFFFWPYMCFKLVGGCSPLSLMHSIICHASRFSPTTFATSSVHHPWFLLLGVLPFPDVLPHSSSATPITEEFEEGTPWAMLFADDLVLCDPDREMMELRLERWRECMENNGLKLSRAKTEHLQTPGVRMKRYMETEMVNLPTVQSFKCLGSTIGRGGGASKDVENTVTHAWSKW